MNINNCSDLMARRRGPKSDEMFRIWRPIPKQKDGSSCGVSFIMVRVRLFHVTSKDMGTGHRCDRETQAFAEFHFEIRVGPI